MESSQYQVRLTTTYYVLSTTVGPLSAYYAKEQRRKSKGDRALLEWPAVENMPGFGSRVMQGQYRMSSFFCCQLAGHVKQCLR